MSALLPGDSLWLSWTAAAVQKETTASKFGGIQLKQANWKAS